MFDLEKFKEIEKVAEKRGYKSTVTCGATLMYYIKNNWHLKVDAETLRYEITFFAEGGVEISSYTRSDFLNDDEFTKTEKSMNKIQTQLGDMVSKH